MLGISPDTRVKITMGLLGTLCLASIALGWRGATLLGRIEGRLATVEQDRYSLTAASEQALRMALENPGLAVPDPRDPKNIIVVRTKVIP